MKAFKIDSDGVTELHAEEHEILDPDKVWDCASLDADHDIWVEDGSLLTSLATATVGGRHGIPLPAYVMGARGEDTVAATLDIETVRTMVALDPLPVRLS